MKKDNLILTKSFDFAVQILAYSKEVREQQHWDIARQVLKSGTSVGANVHEAMAAQSRPDFVAKMSIASKEAREVNYWLRLIKESRLLDSGTTEELLIASGELVSILTAIVKTARTNP